MKERILMKRLMALTVAFMLMFGSSLTVLAATIEAKDIGLGRIDPSNEVVEIIFSTGGSNEVTLDGVRVFEKQNDEGKYCIELPGLIDGHWYEIIHKDGDDNGWTIEIATAMHANEAAPEAAPSGDSGHLHTMEWIIGREPTETQDGLYQYKCTGCDHVEAQQPITYFGVIIKKIIKAIEEAPENGTVIIDNEFLRCFTDEIVAALLARPDVTVDVWFTEGEVAYRFLVPAGQAPTDGQEWYGYFYLGGVLYGWQVPVTEEEA